MRFVRTGSSDDIVGRELIATLTREMASNPAIGTKEKLNVQEDKEIFSATFNDELHLLFNAAKFMSARSHHPQRRDLCRSDRKDLRWDFRYRFAPNTCLGMHHCGKNFLASLVAIMITRLVSRLADQ